MYTTADFLNRPLLSVSDGKIAGTVVSFGFDEKLKRLTHLIVGKGENYFSVPVALILKKDNDALVVADSGGLSPFELNSSFNPVKLPVYGTSGTLTDKVSSVRFDEKFRVKEIQGESRLFLPNEIASASPDAVVIKDCKIPRKKTTALIPKKAAAKQPAGKLVLPTLSAGNFNFLIGRRADKTVLDRKSEILIKNGGVITPEILRQARVNGKLLELSLHAVK